MKQYWQKYCSWFDARNERERVLIIIVSVVALMSIWLILISDPQSGRRAQLEAQYASLKSQQSAFQAQIKAIIDRSLKDPNKVNEQKITQLQVSITKLNDELQQKMRGFVDPARMAAMLEDVLKQKSKLELVRLESLPAEYMFAESTQKQKNENKTLTGLYRHGVRIELQGKYLDTLEYVKALEELQWDFYWDAMKIEVIQYPQARIVLELHTLSLKEGWIGV